MEIAIIVIIVVIGMVVLILKSSNTDTDRKRAQQGYVRTPEEIAKYDAVMRETNRLRNNESSYINSEISGESNIEHELRLLKDENNKRAIESELLLSLRQTAQAFEKNNKLEEAINVYLKAIEKGETSKRLNIFTYAYDIDRVIVLYGKTKQTNLLVEFLSDKITRYPDFNGVKDWAVRLSKLQNNNNRNADLRPSDIVKQMPQKVTLGKRLEQFKRSMPEFNFYFDLPEGADTLSYYIDIPQKDIIKLHEYRDAFDTIKSLAKIAENEGDFKKAIEAFEKLAVEEYEDPEPYERLMVIYSKLGWKEEEIRVIEHAISFFTQLIEKQKEYVLSLANKYGMRDKALEYILPNKKIFYYKGIFELYNPQITRLKKWEEKLDRIKKEKQKILA